MMVMYDSNVYLGVQVNNMLTFSKTTYDHRKKQIEIRLRKIKPKNLFIKIKKQCITFSRSALFIKYSCTI